MADDRAVSMATAKVYSIQPRFKRGDVVGGWSLVDSIFRLGVSEGVQVPAYGSELRDAFLSLMWVNEPMLAGAISTWVEQVQTAEWKLVGGRNNARYYANMFANAEGGLGWTNHIGMGAMDYLVCDKGFMEELGRQSARSTVGRVMDILHLDAARMVRTGKPKSYWRYYPEHGNPVDIPDDNLIQIASLPQGRDRFRGYGYCAMSRLLDAKNLMLGYITYFRQEIGDIPPELVVIINNLPATTVQDSLKKYKMDREGRGDTVYPKIWWLGSDDPAAPVQMSIHSLTTPNKAFNYATMTEWWIKTIALNLGEDVGEFWLLQSGESKTVQSIQAQKARGKGTARFLQEVERRYNLDIVPFDLRFEFDNRDDDQDRARADILATHIGNLDKMANMGVMRQELIFTVDEIRQMAVEWDVIPASMATEEVPHVIGSMLKELYDPDVWVVDRQLREYPKYPDGPVLRGREARAAREAYWWFRDMYGLDNHNGRHRLVEEAVL